MFSIMINGGLVGYFPGARGLRQGDSISPYLFLLVIEAFSSLLTQNIGTGDFQYHPKCQSLGISHVAFADDLFILNGAHSESLQIILHTLKQFYGFSGLQPNLLKGAIYFAGVPTLSRLSFSDLLGIPEGRVPVKYLGSLQLVLDLLLQIVLCSRIRFWPESIVGLRNLYPMVGGFS